jgi:hypothetical protein
MREPIRWVQTNLRQTDASLDALRLVGQLSDMRANVLLIGMGGIAAYYPTRVAFHYPSPDLPAGRDMFGDVLRDAHATRHPRGGPVRFQQDAETVFDAHPEWFFRQANGDPVIYNGLYSTCINGGYYRAQAMKILAEALDNYDVDGLFFNMFGNQSRDYSGHEVGLCHCDACQKRYRAMFHKELPAQAGRRLSAVHVRLLARGGGGDWRSDPREAARKPGTSTTFRNRPTASCRNRTPAVDRPLPMWPYSASDNVNRARNSEPGKMAVNLNMQFVDYVVAVCYRARAGDRAAHVAEHRERRRADLRSQRHARPAGPSGAGTAKPVFPWVAQERAILRGRESAARVLLLGASQKTGRTYPVEPYRGRSGCSAKSTFRSRFQITRTGCGKARFRSDVIATDWAPAELLPYAERGGHVLVMSSERPIFRSPTGIGKTRRM